MTMVIEGVDRYRVIEPMFECARVVMSYRGENYSPAYVQGIAGTAFTLGGICPCAPTCVKVPYATADLLRLFGYEVTPVTYQAKSADADAQYATFLNKLKSEASAGRPVIVWHAFTNYEWDVVCGYDEDAKTLSGYGSYAGGDQYATSSQDRPKGGMDVSSTIALIVGQKPREFDAEAAEMAALKFGIEHAQCQKNAEKFEKPEWAFFEGMLCYKRWARDFTDLTRKRGSGDSYCLGVISSTRRCAARFMEELASKYPAADRELLMAAAAFTNEADTLEALKPMLWWNAPEGPDAERNAKASTLIAQASEHYRRGIRGMQLTLATLQGCHASV
jgi:hypothetical protein